MGTTIDAVKLVLSSLLSTEPWMRDPNVVKMPWDGNVETSTLARANLDDSANGGRPLRIGIYWSDGVVTPQPPVSRGLKIVHDLLESLGHKVVDWEPPSQSTAKRVHVSVAGLTTMYLAESDDFSLLS